MIAALVFTLAAIAIPPAPTQYVTDNVGALSSTTRDYTETELRAFEKSTGNQVIVWIGDTTGDTPLEEWTAQAGEVWKVGQKGKDNGAILFLFMHDRKVRIEVGYGLESKLTDAQSSHIINDMILPAMRNGDVDAAVQGGVDGMLAVIDPSYAPASPSATSNSSSSDDDNGVGEGVAALVVGGIFLLLFFAVIVTIVRRGKKHGDWLDLFLMSGAMGSGGAWSSGGGFGGGGGFSGGGGGFGGGGASGGW